MGQMYQVNPKAGPKFDRHYRAAKKAVEANNPKGALKHFTEILKIAPWLGNAWLMKAEALQQLGRLNEARLCFEKALEHEPEAPVNWLRAGYNLVEMGQLELALEHFRTYEEMNPEGFLEAWCQQGITLFHLGRFEEALATFQKIVKKSPDSEGYLWIGRSLRKLERLDEALDAFNEGLEINADNPLIRYEMGGIFETQDLEDAAIAQYRLAVKSHPEFFEALDQLAVLYQKRHRFEDSLEYAERACALRSEPRALMILGMALFNLGYIEDAKRPCDRSISLQPHHNDPAYMLRAQINIAFFSSQYDRNQRKAWKSWQRALDCRTHVSDAYWRSSVEAQFNLWEENGDFEEEILERLRREALSPHP